MRLRMGLAVVLVGLASGVAGVLLTVLLHAVQFPLYGYHTGSFLAGVEHAPPWRRVLAMAVGGAVVGTGWWWHRRYVDGDALSVVRMLRDGPARLPVGHSLIDAALQVVAVGAGASLGREGAPRQSAAAVAGWIGDRLAITPAQRRTLLACGAGAGLSAMYGVPLTGALFTLELLLVSRAWRDVVPAVLTSAIAAAVALPILGTRPVYDVPAASFAWPVLVWSVPFGVVAGLVALGFTRLMRAARVSAPPQPATIGTMVAGFALVGLVSAAYPAILGNGKGLAQVAFAGGTTLGTAALLAVLKPLATAVCLRAGAIGGLLTPALATGVALGVAGGDVWSRWWPGGAPVDYALVGAAALVAVTQRAALTAIVFAIELTRTGLTDLPAMAVAVGVAIVVARAVSGAPVRDTPQVRKSVVAAAILRLERGPAAVLAARRTGPPQTAGRWELPGGKVEAGETPETALAREIGEELGCVVEVLDWLDGSAPIGADHELRAATCRITAGEPKPREHDRLRWLTAEQLDDVDWLEPDLPFVAQLQVLLRAPGSTRRAVFFEEEDARGVAEGLEADGWWAQVARERYQGEDDDESHPWAVETDAPDYVLDLLVDEYDGWLDDQVATLDGSVAPEPVDLPTAPRRIKRPPVGE